MKTLLAQQGRDGQGSIRGHIDKKLVNSYGKVFFCLHQLYPVYEEHRNF